MGLISFQCIVGQWRLDLQTFRLAATIPIQINSVSRGSTVYTWILVCAVSFLLSHTLFVSLENMVAALLLHLSSLTSRESVSEIVEPRYMKS